MTLIYLFEITINCRYGRYLTLVMENKHDVDLLMELTDYNRLASEGMLPIQYNREIKYKKYEYIFFHFEILNYDQALQKWLKYIQLYESLKCITNDFNKLFIKDHEGIYLSFNSIDENLQNILNEFYDCCESPYNRGYSVVKLYYNDIVQGKNIKRRKNRSIV